MTRQRRSRYMLNIEELVWMLEESGYGLDELPEYIPKIVNEVFDSIYTEPTKPSMVDVPFNEGNYIYDLLNQLNIPPYTGLVKTRYFPTKTLYLEVDHVRY